MARPPARELTERELEVMHVFWSRGEATAAEARDELAAVGPRPGVYDGGDPGPDPGRQGVPGPGQRRPAVPLPAGPVVRGRLAEAAGRPARPGLPGVPRAALVRLMEQDALTTEERARLADILRETEP